MVVIVLSSASSTVAGTSILSSTKLVVGVLIVSILVVAVFVLIFDTSKLVAVELVVLILPVRRDLLMMKKD